MNMLTLAELNVFFYADNVEVVDNDTGDVLYSHDKTCEYDTINAPYDNECGAWYYCAPICSINADHNKIIVEVAYSNDDDWIYYPGEHTI